MGFLFVTLKVFDECKLIYWGFKYYKILWLRKENYIKINLLGLCQLS